MFFGPKIQIDDFHLRLYLCQTSISDDALFPVPQKWEVESLLLLLHGLLLTSMLIISYIVRLTEELIMLYWYFFMFYIPTRTSNWCSLFFYESEI